MSSTTPLRNAGAGAGTPARPWLILWAMTGSLSMVMLDQTVVTVALPTMTRELPLSPTGQQWVVNAYVLAMAALVALGGKAGDLFGSISTYRVGIGLFAVASIGCGLAPHGEFGEPVLIGFRVLQGAGAALMMPASASVVMAAFPAARRGTAMAAYSGISQIFLAVGPLLGGVLTQAVSWRAVFWLNVPIATGSLLLVRLARPSNGRRAAGRISATSVAVLVVGMTAVVLPIQQASSWGWDSPVVLGLLAAGVALLAGFTVAQLRSRAPLVNVRLFARRDFLGDVTVMGLTQFALLAAVLFGSLYFQDLLSFGPIDTGLAVLPLILPLTAASQISGRWYDKTGVRPPVLTGLAVATVGLFAWAAALPSLDYAWIVPGMVLTGLGVGLTISPTNTDGLSRVGVGERSQASGLLQTVRQVGGTLGVAIVGAVILAREPGGTSAAVSTQTAADATMAGFVVAAAAMTLALVAGHRLLSPARTGQPVSTPAADGPAATAAKVSTHHHTPSLERTTS